jgi:hypothetical protein
MKITSISYSRVFSLGNYENEKIGFEAEIQEGEDSLKAFHDLKLTVEHAHAFRQEAKEYEFAQHVMNNPDQYIGYKVKEAREIVKKFQEKYPNVITTPLSILPAPEENGDQDF